MEDKHSRRVGEHTYEEFTIEKNKYVASEDIKKGDVVETDLKNGLVSIAIVGEEPKETLHDKRCCDNGNGEKYHYHENDLKETLGKFLKFVSKWDRHGDMLAHGVFHQAEQLFGKDLMPK